MTEMKFNNCVKESNKRQKRVVKYERELQIIFDKICSKENYIKDNRDNLSERYIADEKVRIHYMNRYCDFLTNKLEKNRV